MILFYIYFDFKTHLVTKFDILSSYVDHHLILKMSITTFFQNSSQ